MKNKQNSTSFQRFINYVFGDPRNYYHDGLSEDIYTSLSSEERDQADEMIIESLYNGTYDERIIEAVGRFRIKKAIPKIFNLYSQKYNEYTRMRAAWVLYRIENASQYVDVIIEYIEKYYHDKQKQYSNEYAISCLADFGKNPKSVEYLLNLRDEEGKVPLTVVVIIYNLFEDNPNIRKLINIYDPMEARNNWDVVQEEVRKLLVEAK